MASKYGYMATIGADTSGMTEALKAVEADTKNITRELKEVNSGLKFDGRSTELMSDKMNLLSQAIEKTKDKLNSLKSVEKDINSAAEKGDISTEQQQKYQREVANTESQLRIYQQQLKNTQIQLDNVESETEQTAKETKQLDTAISNAGGSVISFGDIFKANILSDVVMGGIRRLTSEFVDFAKDSIEVAKNLTEVQNVVDVTFGNDAEQINDWSKKAKEAYGISELTAKQYTGTMGAMLKSSGIAAESVTGLSEDIVGLAGDMASFYNLDISTAFEKIRSGISGETEPLKQLGINMSVANMEAFALSQGIEKSWRSMSQAEQTQLRYAYLMEQTADAQGDFARTSDSLANQQRIAELNMQELKATMGEKLLPVVNELMGVVNEKMPDIEQIFDKIGDAVVNLTEFAIDNKEAIAGMVATLGTITVGTKLADTASKAVKLGKETATALGFIKPAAEIAETAITATATTTVSASAKMAASITAVGTAASAVALPLLALTAIVGGVALALKAMDEDTNGLKNAADESKVAVEEQTTKVNELDKELQSVSSRIDEINSKDGLTITDEQELINLQLQSTELTNQLAIEKELLEIKRQQASEDNYAAIMADSSNSVGSIANVQQYIAQYDDYAQSIKNTQDNLNAAVEAGDEELANYYREGIKTMEDEQLRIEQNALTALQSVNTLSDGLDNTTEEGKAAKQAVSDLNSEIMALFDITADSPNTTTYQVSYKVGEMADYYMQQGKAKIEQQKEQMSQWETDLKSGLDDIESQYNRHLITDANGNQDEAAYYQKKREYLEQYCDSSSETWWKYWDEVNKFQDDAQKDQEESAKKAADESEKQRVEDIKNAWSKIETQRSRGDIDEEAEYTLKAQLVKKYCDENEDTWDSYYTWLYNYQKDKNDKINENELKNWEDNSKSLSDTLEKSYDDLVKQKKKVKEELLSIDLTQTVKDRNGNDVTVLNDLEAATKALDKYQSSVNKLKATGISDDLLSEVMGKSYENGDRQNMINAILNLSKKNRQIYYEDYNKYITKAEQVAQSQVQDQVNELNSFAENAVDGVFSSMPASAYESGAETAQSFLQGIIDNMGGVNDLETAMQILNFNSNSERKNVSANSTNNQTSVALSTPITINLNDRDFITTTIGDLINAGQLTGGNTFNQ